MENNKGTFKKKIGEIEIKNAEISEAITSALLEKGYDLVSKPIMSNFFRQIGEKLIIYKG